MLQENPTIHSKKTLNNVNSATLEKLLKNALEKEKMTTSSLKDGQENDTQVIILLTRSSTLE